MRSLPLALQEALASALHDLAEATDEIVSCWRLSALVGGARMRKALGESRTLLREVEEAMKEESDV